MVICQCKQLNIILAGVDYGQNGVTSYSVTFTPGSTMQSIMIPINNDNIREGNENFRVAINPLSMLGVIVGTPNTSIITIIETTGKVVLIIIHITVSYVQCTEIAVRFSSGHYQATEISGGMEVEIILIRGFSNVPVGVAVRLRSGSATGGYTYTSIVNSSHTNYI